jgi:hypothetical protein
MTHILFKIEHSVLGKVLGNIGLKLGAILYVKHGQIVILSSFMLLASGIYK